MIGAGFGACSMRETYFLETHMEHLKGSERESCNRSLLTWVDEAKSWNLKSHSSWRSATHDCMFGGKCMLPGYLPGCLAACQIMITSQSQGSNKPPFSHVTEWLSKLDANMASILARACKLTYGSLHDPHPEHESLQACVQGTRKYYSMTVCRF